MRVEHVGAADALETLAGEWAALWSRSITATPFQRPEWLVPWWQCFGAGAELRALVVRDGAELAGLLPLVAWGRGGGRRAVLLGTGNSDYLDLIADAQRAGPVVAAIWDYLATRRHEWPPVELTDLPRGSPLLAGDGIPASLQPSRVPHDVCLVTRLPPTFAQLELYLPGWLRRNLRQGRARLERLGDPRWLRPTASTLEHLLDELFRLHTARWRLKGQPGVLAVAGMRAFHGRAAAGLLRAGLLRLHALELGGRIVAVIYGMRSQSVVFYYLSGFDPELQRCNPGALLVARLLSTAIEEGCTACDLLRGREPYKYAWGGEEKQSWRLRLL